MKTRAGQVKEPDRSGLRSRRRLGGVAPGWWLLGSGVLLLAGAAMGQGNDRAPRTAPKPAVLSAASQAFLKQSCLGCHSKANASGGLDLSLPFRPADPANFERWVKVYDRVTAGEMPPTGAAQPAPAARKRFLAEIRQPLLVADAERVMREGRATWRRMNRYEYENSLRDLLDAPWLQIKEMLPEDGLAARFNKVGEALDVSHVQLSRYLQAAQYALREALRQAQRPPTSTTRYYAREQRSFVGAARFSVFNQSPERATFPIIGDEADVPALKGTAPMTVGDKDPEKREQEAMGVVASAYEPLQPKFDRFRAPVSGRYRFRLRGHSFWAEPESQQRWWRPSREKVSAGRTLEPITLYASSPPNVLRRLGTVDVGPKPTVCELEGVLLKGETIQVDAARLFRSRPPGYRNPLATPEGQPGVAYQWLEVEGPLLEQWPTRGQRLLAGDLPLKAGRGGRVEIVPRDPNADGERLVRNFVKQALRRPATEEDVQPFVQLFHKGQSAGADFTEALLTAYAGVLCSPAFVTLEERPGLLDDHALATRLSYFLWNSAPDAELRKLADAGKLSDPKVLATQVDRLLADERSQRFVEAFLDYWLDLRKADDTSPDEALYSDYYLDDYLTESSVLETRAFITELLRENLPARNLVDSDFLTINERLAALYNVPGVQGSAIRRVPLPEGSVRGGLLTQASVLKVTANGTTTSPVLRGVWINERILGQPVPAPPASVPAVEPDIRGATTIREQLDKHRNDATCRSCHVKIDPPGFALESFDVFGGFREHYRALGEGKKVPGYGKNGQAFAFHLGPRVDASGELPDGRKFADIREFKRLLLQDERQIARNLVRQLVTYSTGAPVGFSDRPKVEAILDRAAAGGYGVRSLVHGIVASELFRNK